MPAPYTRRFPGGFVDKPATTTPTEAAFYNNMEDALLALLGDTPVADEVGVWVGGASGGLVYQKIKNAQIDAAAAIDKSKLGPLNIADADVASAANISKSKLGPLNISQADVVAGNKVTAQAIASGPPANPTTGDIWIATAVDPNGEIWQFRYNGASASAYKWEFIGGSPIARYGTGTNNTNSSSAVDVGLLSSITLPRAGDYLINATALGGTNTSTVGLRLYYQLNIGGSAAGAVMMSSNKGTSNDASDVHFNIWHRINGAAASAVVKTQFHTNDGTYTMYVTPKILSVVPFRIS